MREVFFLSVSQKMFNSTVYIVYKDLAKYTNDRKKTVSQVRTTRERFNVKFAKIFSMHPSIDIT